jgi:putative FmdB family regulatory protein
VPTYQYACTTCGHQLEAVQSFADEPLTECPACEGRLRKLFGSVGIVFKGSGFYRTDSRSGGSNGSSGNGEGAKSESSGSKDSSATDGGTASKEKAGAATGSSPADSSSGNSSSAKSAAAAA